MTENPYDPNVDGEDREFTGPDGVQDAEPILEVERDRDGESLSENAADLPAELGEDKQAAADQGNRSGDEMVAEDADPTDDDGSAALLATEEDSVEGEDVPFQEIDPLARRRDG